MFTGEMLEAFMILNDEMKKKGDENLIKYGKFQQSHQEGSVELMTATDLHATEFNTTLASKVNNDLAATVKTATPENIKPFMKEMVEICSNYLAQHAEYNKDKGPAFRHLIKSMKGQGTQLLYKKDKASRTLGTAATELETSKGLETDHDDPALTQKIHTALSNLVKGSTPPELKADMDETLNVCSKYLSECAVDENERGPAYDILIKALERTGDVPFSPEHKHLPNNFAAGYTLKSAPGLTGVTPDTSTAPKFKDKLNKIVATATPSELKEDMKGVVERAGNYLSAYERDRDKVLAIIVKQLQAGPQKELVKSNDTTLNYGSAAKEIEVSPTLVPYLPVKDIAEDAKAVLTKETDNVTPAELRVAMKSATKDVAQHLSQGVAIKSGAAGERYKLNFLAAIKQSLGKKSLFKHKAYAQTYSDGAKTLQSAGPMEHNPDTDDLRYKIQAELDRGLPERLTPTVQSGLTGTIDDASKHLAKVGTEKGEALDYVVGLMKGKGEQHLANMQGYDQSYGDGATRVENSPTLANSKVEKATYENVKGKITTLTDENPHPTHSKHMPGIVDETSKFLAKPMPETDEEKRYVLGDLMARKGNTQFDKEGIYKITFKEGGEELMNAPVGVTKSKDEKKKGNLKNKVHEVIPNDTMKNLLQGPIDEGAAHLSDIIKGRGAAMQVIHDKMKAEDKTDFLTAGKFKTDHGQAAETLKEAPYFTGGEYAAPYMVDQVKAKIDNLSKQGASELAKAHMQDTTEIASKYLGAIATKESGLNPKDLLSLDAQARANINKGDRVQISKPKDETGETPIIGPPNKIDSNNVGPIATRESGLKPKDLSRLDSQARANINNGDGVQISKPKDETGETPIIRPPSSRDDEYRLASKKILREQLESRGEETLHKVNVQKTPVELSHRKASVWMDKSSVKLDRSIKDSPDTARLHKKFERKLSFLVQNQTPVEMREAMQDVVIESSRLLSEKLIKESYQNQAKFALISEMQKRRNEILTEVDGASETYFFAAQRLKKQDQSIATPCSQVSYEIQKKLDDCVRCRTMARKLIGTTKEIISGAADYLSSRVTKPDEEIEAYIALLNEMESAGDSLLISGAVNKSHKDAADYLRSLVIYEDTINMHDDKLQKATEDKLTQIMSNLSPNGYTVPALQLVIKDSTRLLVSYIKLQELMTSTLKTLVDKMEQAGDNVLLRHGNVRKSFKDGAALLANKNADDLVVTNVIDPVVERKIQIKLNNLMDGNTPEDLFELMSEVIQNATMYLSVHLLDTQVIKVCKCMKNVFVQCELWCDEILRRVSRPCCSCDRHVSSSALADLTKEKLKINHRSSKAYAPGVDVSIRPCPARPGDPASCPAPVPTKLCGTSTYFMQANTSFSRPKLLPTYSKDSESFTTTGSLAQYSGCRSHSGADLIANHYDLSKEPNLSSDYFHTPTTASELPSDLSPTRETSIRADTPYFQQQTMMFTNLEKRSPSLKSEYYSETSNSSQTRPTVRTDQMPDWHSMMVSLMWNVQSWKDWIQANINRGREGGIVTIDETSSSGQREGWANFERKVTEEVMQWQQYNSFSKKLAQRLATRYKDKEIVSPSGTVIKTKMYMECQHEMLNIIHMFNRWTLWLFAMVKETCSLEVPDASSEDFLRWCHFANKVKEYEEDWTKYNMHLKVCWEHKYRSLIADWLPSWKQPGPVWVISAFGAVPSGAVAAGLFQGEVSWIARTTHKCKVLPAAVLPSKHCCLVYADGNIHHYTKYQVMCNAEVKWKPWRSGAMSSAVRVAPGVHVGRINYRGSHLLGAVHAPHYRCHVVIFGRPFAFNCYELLVLAE